MSLTSIHTLGRENRRLRPTSLLADRIIATPHEHPNLGDYSQMGYLELEGIGLMDINHSFY